MSSSRVRPGRLGAAARGQGDAAGGGPDSPAPPPGRSVYAQLVADIFLTYCTNAAAAQREHPALQVVEIPDSISVGADYGITVRRDAPAAAHAFADALIDGAGQPALRAAGFKAP